MSWFCMGSNPFVDNINESLTKANILKVSTCFNYRIIRIVSGASIQITLNRESQTKLATQNQYITTLSANKSNFI